MTIKLKQKMHRFGSRNGWKGELTGLLFVALFLSGIGIAVLGHGIFGEPKYHPGKELAISARAFMLMLGAVLTPLGLYFGYQAIRTFQERHKIDEREFTLPGVTSYEVLSDAEGEALQRQAKKRKRWSF